MSIWSQLNFQDANSPIMESFILFHDYTMLIIILILVMIMYIIMFMIFQFFSDRMLIENQMIEIIWTIVPMLLLLFLALPSLKILYLTDEIDDPEFTVKILGHQWYWSYEFNDYVGLITFDSFLSKESIFRLLNVDNHLVLPVNTQIRMLISSSDVIHSFTVPTLGFKIDAIPGRLNQVSTLINRPGLYFGQCSEICGVNHSFMPIVLESVKFLHFIEWILEKSYD